MPITKLLAFNNTWHAGQPPHDWNNGYVIDPEGKVVAGHCSSSDMFLRADLGYLRNEDGSGTTGPGQLRLEEFAKLYPEGFEIEWVEDSRIGKHEELSRRAELNRLMHEKDKAAKA
jgi:hypothetical protein